MKPQIKALPILNALLSVLLIILFASSCQKEDRITTPMSSGNEQKVIENSKDVPVEDVFYNECCGEDMFASGAAHVIISDNIIHVTVKDITGVGLSTGYDYTGVGSSVNNIPFYNNHYDGQLTFHLNMENANDCSFMLNITLHITVNPNGDVTAEVENITTHCN